MKTHLGNQKRTSKQRRKANLSPFACPVVSPRHIIHLVVGLARELPVYYCAPLPSSNQLITVDSNNSSIHSCINHSSFCLCRCGLVGVQTLANNNGMMPELFDVWDRPSAKLGGTLLLLLHFNDENAPSTSTNKEALIPCGALGC